MNEVKLSVAATGESVYVLRTVLASLAARMDFSLDEIDDLYLAVSEAAAFLVNAGNEASRLNMRASSSRGGITAVLWIDGSSIQWPPPAAENGLAWKILSALTDEAQFVDEPEGPGIRLWKQGFDRDASP